MSIQPTGRVDLDIIEALDYEHTPPCEHTSHGEHPLHDGPAYALVLAHCQRCDDGTTLYLCRKALEGIRRVKCFQCNTIGEQADFWTVLAIVGGVS